MVVDLTRRIAIGPIAAYHKEFRRKQELQVLILLTGTLPDELAFDPVIGSDGSIAVRVRHVKHPAGTSHENGRNGDPGKMAHAASSTRRAAILTNDAIVPTGDHATEGSETTQAADFLRR